MPETHLPGGGNSGGKPKTSALLSPPDPFNRANTLGKRCSVPVLTLDYEILLSNESKPAAGIAEFFFVFNEFFSV